MDTQDRSFVFKLLRDIQLKGYLDYEYVVSTTCDLVNKKSGSFFQILTKKFICKYSSDRAFTQNSLYRYDDLPESQFPIYKGPDLIAILCIEDLADTLPPETHDTFHNTLSVGVTMTKNRDAMNSLEMSVCTETGQLLTTVVRLMDSTPTFTPTKAGFSQANYNAVCEYTAVVKQNLATAGRTITSALTLNFDARDFIGLDAGLIPFPLTDVIVRDLFRELTDTFQAPGQKNILIGVNDSVPRSLRFCRPRVKQVLDTVMQKLSDSGSINIEVDALPTRERHVTTLHIRIRTALKIDAWFNFEIVTAKTLTNALLDRLCTFMKGEMSIDDDTLGLQLRFRCELPATNVVFQGKQVLLCIANQEAHANLFSLYTDWGSIPTSCSGEPTLYLPHIERFNLVVTDPSYNAFVPRIRKRGIPVLGVIADTAIDRSMQFSNFFDSTVTLPVDSEDLAAKSRALWAKNNQ